MSSKQSLRDDILLHGYQTKLKTMKKKYFVLFSKTVGNCARLEYFDNEKKFKIGSSPKRIIKLKNCFNINRRLDTKHEYVIALATKDYGFGIVLESELEMIKWLDALTTLQRNEDRLSAKPPIYFEHVWQVLIQRKGLAEEKCLIGNYHVCLTANSLTLIKIGIQKQKEEQHVEENVDILLTTIRRCGDSQCYFYMEVGRQSIIGPGELWMETEDTLIAQNMHNMILSAMLKKSESSIDPMRQRSLSANEASKPTHMLQQNFTKHGNTSDLHVHKDGMFSARGRCDSLPTSRNQNPSERCSHSLMNLTLLPTNNRPSLDLQNLELNQRQFTILKSYSKNEKCNLSIDSLSGNISLTPHRYFSQSSQNTIPEEKTEEMVFVEKNCDELSELLSNMSKLGNSQIVNYNTDVNKKNSEFLCLPTKIYSMFSNCANQSSSKLLQTYEHYTLMRSNNNNVFASERPMKKIEDLKLISNVSSESHEVENTSGLPRNNNRPSLKWKTFDDPTMSKAFIRTSSVNNPPDHHKKKEFFSNKSSSETSRVRAFSVGSKIKIPFSDLRSNILTSRISINCNQNISSCDLEYNKVSKNKYEKKSTSDPILNSSIDRMSDLMEIDFSKHRIKRPASSNVEKKEHEKALLINYDQLNTQNEMSNKSLNSNFMDYSSVSPTHENNAYLDMKPVALIHGDYCNQINNDISSLQLKESEINCSDKYFWKNKHDSRFHNLFLVNDTSIADDKQMKNVLMNLSESYNNKNKHEEEDSLLNEHFYKMIKLPQYVEEFPPKTANIHILNNVLGSYNEQTINCIDILKCIEDEGLLNSEKVIVPSDLNCFKSRINDYAPIFTPTSQSIVSSSRNMEKKVTLNSFDSSLSKEYSPHRSQCNNANKVVLKQEKFNVLKSNSEMLDLEICYASLDLPQYQSESNHNQSNKNLTTSENIDITSRMDSQPNLSYARIKFDQRDEINE